MIQKIANKIAHITAKWRFPVIRNYHEDKIIGFTFDNILSGDIILTYKKGEFSNIYTNLFGDFWKHASIVINKHTAIEAVAPRVNYKRIDSLLLQSDHFCVLRVKDLTVQESEVMVDIAHSLIRTPYDFSFDVKDVGEVYCSELIYHCIKDIRKVTLKKRLGVLSFSPQDIYNAKNIFKEIIGTR